MKVKRWIYILTTLWLLFVMVMATWWYYLVIRLNTVIVESALPDASGMDIGAMMRWEGLTFFIVLFFLSVTIFKLFLTDLRRSKSIQTFFAALTHELKTPLTNIQLQTEFVSEMLKNKTPPEQFDTYINRINQGVDELKNELNKILELSRIERGGELNLEQINLMRFLNHFVSKKQMLPIKLLTVGEIKNSDVAIDEVAMGIILNNLINNTLDHSQAEKKEATISIEQKKNKIFLTYQDNGSPFLGDVSELGTIFYKYHSPKGSGIGIYLSKQLALKMHGDLFISNEKSLKFTLQLPLAEN